MKTKIVETLSMQEALRELNRKPTSMVNYIRHGYMSNSADVEDLVEGKKRVIESVDEDYSNYAFALGGEFANGLGGDTIVYSDFKLTDDGWTYTNNVETFGPFETLFDCIKYQLDRDQTPEEVQETNEISDIDDLRLWTFVSKSLAAQLSSSEIAKIQQYMDAYDVLPSVKDASFEICDIS